MYCNKAIRLLLLYYIYIRSGTNQIDTSQTGIPYFKHDFGYEFGVVYPVQTKHGKTADPTDTVSIPVAHEFSKNVQYQTREVSKLNMRQDRFNATATGEGFQISELLICGKFETRY